MEEEKQIDVLFVGATRPPMVLGVTLEAFLVNGIVSAIIFLGVGNPLYLLISVPFHFLAYMACLNEPRYFKLFALKLKLMSKNRNRMYWKCNSYSPFNPNLDGR